MLDTSILTPDFLSSQRRVGATNTQIADLVAKRDHGFANEYGLIKQKAEGYSNPDDFIGSYLSYKVHGDANYKDANTEQDIQARYDVPGSAGFSRNDVQNDPNVLSRMGKVGANWAVGAVKLPYTVAKAGIGMALSPRETIKTGGLAVEGAIADAYQGITGQQMPTFNPDGTMTATGPTPGQQQFHSGFLEHTLGASSLLRGNINDAAQSVTTGILTDPASTALALSPLTKPRPIDPKTGLPQINPHTGEPVVGSYLGPISTASDMIGKGISATADRLESSAEASAKAAREAFAQKLISPKETAAVKLDQTMRTTEKGVGPFKRSVVAPTKREVQMANAVSELPLNPKGTYQSNLNIIKEANIAEAEALKTSLEANNFSYESSELSSRFSKVQGELKNNPVLVGDAAKVADKLISEVKRRIEGSPKDGASLLQVRKDFDSWVEIQKGSGVFDPAKENAFSTALRPIRRAINDFLEEKAPTAGVKMSLSKQSALFDAMDNIAPKAALEANSAWQRVAQKVHEVSGKLRLGPTGVAVTGVGGAYGLWAAPQLAAIIGGVGAGAFFVYKAGKMLMSPKLRIATSQLLHILEKVAIDDPAMYPQVAPLIQEINSLRDGKTPIPSVPRMKESNTGVPNQSTKALESTSTPTLPPSTQPVIPLEGRYGKWPTAEELSRMTSEEANAAKIKADFGDLSPSGAGMADDLSKKFPNLTPEEIASLTPEEKSLGMVGGSDSVGGGVKVLEGEALRKSIVEKTITPNTEVYVYHGTPYWEDIISSEKGIRSGIRKNTPAASANRVYVSDSFDSSSYFSQDQNVSFKLKAKYGDLLPDSDTAKNLRSVGKDVKNTASDTLLQGGAATLKPDTFSIESVLVKQKNGGVVEIPYDGRKTLEAVKQAKSPSPLPKPLGGSDTLAPLIKEARKYKSAEEFASASSKVFSDVRKYAGGDHNVFVKNVGKDGISLHQKMMDYLSSPEVAQLYEKGLKDTQILKDLWKKAHSPQ